MSTGTIKGVRGQDEKEGRGRKEEKKGRKL